MPVTPTYPGVYIEEISGGVRTIAPVATSITAFIGRATRGPANDPITINSFADFQRRFGGLDSKSMMSYAVYHYFSNQGSVAVIVRVTPEGAATSKLEIGIPLEAKGAGIWGDKIQVRVDYLTKDTKKEDLFNLFLYEADSRSLEEFRNVSIDPENARYVVTVLEEESELVRVSKSTNPLSRPGASGDVAGKNEWFNSPGAFQNLAGGGGDTQEIKDADLLGNQLDKKGLYALEKADLFNLLCLPPAQRDVDLDEATWSSALTYCRQRRAMLIIDPPSGWKSISQAVTGVDKLRQALGGEDYSKNSALFFPRIVMPDPLKDNRNGEFVPCGAIAGIFARTDVQRGVWKAPAGINAGIIGIRKFPITMTDPENGQLNPKGVNCLRAFPQYGSVIWGSRTMAGDDQTGSEWKYIPVRRFALFLQESLYRGTQWVVFEPNDEPLWSQIRINIKTFMTDLFRQGAFQGTTPNEAFYVRCDKDTTTQSDINRGIVNIEVGFAPLKPAEFVILKFKQIARQNS